MAVSPDDRFAGLINSSAERGGWVPGDVFGSDSEGEDEPVEPRRVRLPILVALAVVTIAVLVIAFLLFRPAPQHAASEDQAGTVDDHGSASHDGPGTASGDKGGPEAASAAPSTESGDVIVHVTGAVQSPSVVILAPGARVQDAVEAAGGLKGEADAEAINLARVLQDGEQIHIPMRGEDPGPGASDADSAGTNAAGGAEQGAGGGAGQDGGSGSAGSSGTSDSAGASGSASADPNSGTAVNLNTADLTTLETLPGVGPVTAEAIIAYREEQPFATVDDLLLVPGIGPKTFESLKDLVIVG
ncbi:helix-hairpin-helix domain-containing protein [Brevibacterium aurantiacum]|uniref:Competence protein ComEA n=1 Tax=Brevibacterium aurantiacum TaxID=273384 RepID=A0A2H1IRU8_BREAU|nr:helix-hairpin-helix domain-containing protein [Brevibacterium aurantiacum]SMX77830.1 competence protein ComEA [Brevibacterium aurantiacum]